MEECVLTQQVSHKEKTLRKTVIYEIETPSKPSASQTVFSTKPKIRRRRHKYGIVRERCEDLIELQFPFKEVGYNKLRMDMITKLELCDRITILNYLGRPRYTQINRVDQEVRYLKSQSLVLKKHTFKRQFSAMNGYLELFCLATMFEKDGKTWFRIHYENSTRDYHFREDLTPHITEVISP